MLSHQYGVEVCRSRKIKVSFCGGGGKENQTSSSPTGVLTASLAEVWDS